MQHSDRFKASLWDPWLISNYRGDCDRCNSLKGFDNVARLLSRKEKDSWLALTFEKLNKLINLLSFSNEKLNKFNLKFRFKVEQRPQGARLTKIPQGHLFDRALFREKNTDGIPTK